MADSAIDYKKAEELEERYDPEMQFRSTYALAKWLVIGLLFLLSLFHYYTAGFGVCQYVTTVHDGYTRQARAFLTLHTSLHAYDALKKKRENFRIYCK